MAITPCRDRWKGTMTGRQRFNNQMHYRPVDRCFNMEFGYWDENFTQWPMFVQNGIKDNDEADIFFNFDRIVGVGAGPCAGMNPGFGNTVIGETATAKIFINNDGVMAEVPKDGHDTIPHFMKPSIVTPDDWKRCKEERYRLDDPVRVVDVEALKKAHPPTRDYPLGVDCGSMIGVVRNILTFEGICYAIYDYPDMVEDMVENQCRMIELFLDQVLGKIDFDFAVGWEDICFNGGPIVGVDFFKNVVVPRYKRLSKRLHAAGIDIFYTDCDGDVRPILPLFLEGGINCLFPFEVNSCCHPGELFREYGKDLRIMGGFDKMALGQGRDAIKQYMESIVPLVERGGYIPFCDHRCPPNVKQEDYLYYLDLKEQMFGMK